MIQEISADRFLEERMVKPVIDVRSPAEYASGHIPGAVNLPLFDDAEREVIGTIYKQAGREASIIKGLEITGPKMAAFVKKLRVIAPKREILIHCWRGGMRSKNMAWLFSLSGFSVQILECGYKAYRHFIRTALGSDRKYILLGGKTGSGKTEILEKIKSQGLQVIDLEGLANHKGSAFGELGLPPQPTNEQFENDLYDIWCQLNPELPVWVEDESLSIGRVSIPPTLYSRLRISPVIFLDVPLRERKKRIIRDYSGFDPVALAANTVRIRKRLGGKNLKSALKALAEKDFSSVAEILLTYYDKAYLQGLEKRNPRTILTVETQTGEPEQNMHLVLEKAGNILSHEQHRYSNS